MLEGKKILVTGAGRGIGRAIARSCLAAGATVGVHYRGSAAEARALRDEFPDRVHLVSFDVRDAAALQAGVEEFHRAAGAVDGLVNNAGVNRPDLLVSADLERIREQIDVNLLGPILCARAVLPIMMAQRRGVILNVSSVSALRPSAGQSVYAAAKGGVESLTRALAREYGRKGIRVHGLRPGPIDTAMLESSKALAGEEILARIPMQRLGRPEEVGDFAAFLLSDRAAYVSGSIHAIDGGYLEA